jgi:Protein of unknown function (DUF2958)
MMLLTKEIRRRMPMLYAQDGKGEDAVVHLKLFSCVGRGTWYVTEAAAVLADGSQVPLAEADGTERDVLLFGYCESPLGPDCNEWGYTSLRELEAIRHPVFRGMAVIERDMHFPVQTMREVRESERVA